jgi:hypothetical protein
MVIHQLQSSGAIDGTDIRSLYPEKIDMPVQYALRISVDPEKIASPDLKLAMCGV